MSDRKCLNENCRFWHLKGTARHSEDQAPYEQDQWPEVGNYANNQRQANNYTRNQSNRYNHQQNERQRQQPRSQNPPMNNDQNSDFLGTMKEQINQEMVEIRKQQNAFMERISQQIQLIQRPSQENQMQPMQYYQAYPHVHYQG